MTGADPLLRLADELGELGRKLGDVGMELRRLQVAPVRPAPTAAQDPAPAQPTTPPQPVVPVQQAAPVQPVQPVPAQAPVYGPATPPRPMPVPVATAWRPPVAPPPQQHWPVQPMPPPVPRRTLLDRLGEDGAGSRLLAWVGGVVTLLGVVLLLVLAVQRDYLGPLPRVLGGGALALVLIGIGLRLHRSETSRTGAFALAATGVAALYLDVVAATRIYDYLPEWAGLGVGLVVALGGLLLAMRWDSPTFAIGVVLACAVLAPILTGGFTPLLVGFLLVLKTAASPVQWRRNWPWLAIAAGAPAVLGSLLAIGFAVEAENQAPTAAIILLTAVVGVLSALISVRRRPDDVVSVIMVAASPVPALLATALLDKTWATAMTGAVAVLMIALWAVGRTSLPKRFVLAAGVVGVFALLQTTAIALDGSARAATVLVEALLLLLLADRTASRGPLLGGAVFAGLGLLLAVEAIPPRLLAYAPDLEIRTAGTLVGAMLTALVLALVAVALPWAAARRGVLAEPGKSPVALVVAGLVLLYAAAAFVLCAALLVSQTPSGFLFGHTVVTVSWTVAALVLLVRGIDVLPLRIAGLVLVGAAVAKLVLFDLSALDGIARVAAFIGAGLVLLTAGTRYAKLVAIRRNPANS
ncbi:DUF2339 domain-containing protein [Umezawaea sp. Da 62-37]|uniref:DUF2339 domain-containing protein n=1 Tax=Umezawaea sp. Da 62-37 TaxID=3075927 RepID=UPI0028F708F3|nr:DUF2339 domain-containing protein [Umezawaea sp. Da 62-37]WNV91394.1 DUF2339 domain-containing protein [Umezawaea sp. Da 62-37]